MGQPWLKCGASQAVSVPEGDLHLQYFFVLIYSFRAAARADQVASHLFQAPTSELLKADTPGG